MTDSVLGITLLLALTDDRAEFEADRTDGSRTAVEKAFHIILASLNRNEYSPWARRDVGTIKRDNIVW